MSDIISLFSGRVAKLNLVKLNLDVLHIVYNQFIYLDLFFDAPVCALTSATKIELEANGTAVISFDIKNTELDQNFSEIYADADTLNLHTFNSINGTYVGYSYSTEIVTTNTGKKGLTLSKKYTIRISSSTGEVDTYINNGYMLINSIGGRLYKSELTIPA